MAADLSAKVLALVERELKKDPGIQSKKLREKALKVDKSVAALSGRQFHARYALQARRRLFGGATRRGRKAGKGSQTRGKGEAVEQLVVDAYQVKRARLEAAIEGAFKRALNADSIGQLNRLLSALDRHTRELDKT